MQPCIEQFLDALGGRSLTPPWRAGHAWQARVQRPHEAHPMLLTVWDDPARAERAREAYMPQRAGQLFAVPQLVEAGPGWILTQDVPGMRLASWLEARGVGGIVELESSVAVALVESVGRLLRKLHSVEAGDGFGALSDPTKTFSGLVASRLDAHVEALNQLSLPEARRVALLESLGDLRHELTAFHPWQRGVLCHGVLYRRFLWVDERSAEVVGLTGFGHSGALPAEYDLSFFLWMEGIGHHETLARAFYRGYGAARTMDMQRRERFFRRLTAFEALVGELRGVTELDDAALMELASPSA